MRRLIKKLWFKMGWLYMPKWLFVWVYIKGLIPELRPLTEAEQKNLAHVYSKLYVKAVQSKVKNG